jgi:hypothetical protein
MPVSERSLSFVGLYALYNLPTLWIASLTKNIGLILLHLVTLKARAEAASGFGSDFVGSGSSPNSPVPALPPPKKLHALTTKSAI